MSSADAKAVSPDLALVSAIRAGDASAMASLYDRYSSVVYAVALRVLGDTGAAEDIQQKCSCSCGGTRARSTRAAEIWERGWL